jgi:lipoprotein NlpI
MAAKFSECSSCYDNLVSKYPNYCIGYYNRGLAKYYSGDKEGAKIDFEKAYSLGFTETKELLIKYYGQ